MKRGNSMDDADVFRIVDRAINKAGSQSAFTRKVGITRSALCKQHNAKTAKGYTNEVLLAAGIKRFQPPTEYYLMDEI